CPSTSIRSLPSSLREAFAGSPLTATLPCWMSCCTPERLTSPRAAVRNWSRRRPASAGVTVNFCSGICWIVTAGRSRGSFRQDWLTAAEHPERPATRDHQDRDELRGRHPCVKESAASHVAAQEFQEETREAIDKEVSPDDLAIEPLPPEQPEQDEEVRDL